MLPPLDVPTMLLMTAAASLTMACSLAAMRQGRREGTGLWALALMLHTATYILYTLRGAVPDWASIVLANTLLSGTFALVLAAIDQFQGRGLPWRRMVLPVAATTLLSGVFIDDYRARLLVMGILPPLQLLLALQALWQPRLPQVRGAVLLSVGLGLQVLLLSMRGVLVVTSSIPIEGFTRGSSMQSVVFMAAFMVVILASLGFILMTKDRADAANRHFAAHDALTGVANRRSLIAALERDVARAVRTREPYALMMLDIDHFKAVNDTRGHLAGDQVLCHVAAMLRTRLRAQDLVGRYGGEEFLVLLPDTPLRGAMELAEVLRQAVAQTPCMHEGRALPVTVSIGVCGGRLEQGDHGDLLIHTADQALYAAKAAGRNRVEGALLPRDGPPTLPMQRPEGLAYPVPFPHRSEELP